MYTVIHMLKESKPYRGPPVKFLYRGYLSPIILLVDPAGLGDYIVLLCTVTKPIFALCRIYLSPGLFGEEKEERDDSPRYSRQYLDPLM